MEADTIGGGTIIDPHTNHTAGRLPGDMAQTARPDVRSGHYPLVRAHVRGSPHGRCHGPSRELA